jgi:hypothetical protein
MQQRIPTFGSAQTEISELLREWNTALATASASRDADRYACVMVLVMESMDHYNTVHNLIKAYCAPDIGLKSQVLVLCGDGEIRLQTQVVLGAACALRLRQIMEAAIT